MSLPASRPAAMRSSRRQRRPTRPTPLSPPCAGYLRTGHSPTCKRYGPRSADTPSAPTDDAHLPDNVETLRPAQVERVAPLERVPRGTQAREPTEQRADPHERLGARQRRAQAVIGAEREGKMVRHRPRDGESVWVGEAFGIAVH